MRIAEKLLRDAAKEILTGLGEERDSAEIAAEILVRSDMRGVSTHGINLLRQISKRTAAGMLKIPTKVEVVREDATTAILDGNDGLGQVAGYRAMRLSIEKAKSSGLGMVALRNTNNVGALGYYTSTAASSGDVIAICMTNGNPSVAPFGSADPFFGTNPLSVGVPAAEGQPIVLDMSSSVVARGKIRLAALSGESIPLGWACDETGAPTTDPNRALKGSLLPLGGPKGSGLAMIIDILAGILIGSSYGLKLKSFHELEGPTGVGASFIAIDIARFIDPAVFAANLQTYTREMKSLRKQPGAEEILLPGEIEFMKEQQSRISGIDVPEAVAKAIDEILAKSGSRLRIAGN
ncbi:MAG: Ldh family oxidoreductase [Spirochaetes bacterium]|nr:Ldh family oxidoreductase [Spirochaetota bacterium]